MYSLMVLLNFASWDEYILERMLFLFYLRFCTEHDKDIIRIFQISK